jgi:hypothetical protein
MGERMFIKWQRKREMRKHVEQLDYPASAALLRVMATSESDEGRELAVIAGERAYQLAPNEDSRKLIGQWLDALREGRRIKVSVFRATYSTDGTDPMLVRAVNEAFEGVNDDE